MPTRSARQGASPLGIPRTQRMRQDRYGVILGLVVFRNTAGRIDWPHRISPLRTLPRSFAVNRFEHHHRDAIEFGYSCFDRLLLNGRILPAP